MYRLRLPAQRALQGRPRRHFYATTTTVFTPLSSRTSNTHATVTPTIAITTLTTAEVKNDRCFSSTASQTRDETPLIVPPNLIFDPTSSFAPVIDNDINDNDNDYDDDNDNEDDIDKELDNEEEEYVDDDDDDESGAWTMPLTRTKFVIPLPDRLHVNVHSLVSSSQNTTVGTLPLHPNVFGHDDIRIDLITQAVNYIRAKRRGRRNGGAITKTISTVSGSTRKLRPQKGMGRARVGHGRPPHFRGGAKAHGPKGAIQNYGNIKLNKQMKRLALRHTLSQKLIEGNLLLLDHLYELPTHKTKELVQLLEPFQIGTKDGTTALILDHYYPQRQRDDTTDTDTTSTPTARSYRGVPVNFWVASANLYKLTVGNTHAANVYDILKHEKLVLTLSALEQLEARLK